MTVYVNAPLLGRPGNGNGIDAVGPLLNIPPIAPLVSPLSEAIALAESNEKMAHDLLGRLTMLLNRVVAPQPPTAPVGGSAMEKGPAEPSRLDVLRSSLDRQGLWLSEALTQVDRAERSLL